MNENKAAKGKAVMEKLFGAVPESLPFPPRFSDYTVEHLFGDVWQGEALELGSLLRSCALPTSDVHGCTNAEMAGCQRAAL
jgi:hypothetical protein